jgi:hypothetical protein
MTAGVHVFERFWPQEAQPLQWDGKHGWTGCNIIVIEHAQGATGGLVCGWSPPPLYPPPLPPPLTAR